MQLLKDQSWTRRGFSLLWDGETLANLAAPSEVVSIRVFFEMARKWPEDLPSNKSSTLIVAGLEGCLDTLTPEDAETWLERDLKPAILSFQYEYQSEASLILWIPSGRDRINMNLPTECYSWRCAQPYRNQDLPIGRLLWGGAEKDVCRVMNPDATNQDADGPGWIGLHLHRIS
jgi:hypothetical protein